MEMKAVSKALEKLLESPDDENVREWFWSEFNHIKAERENKLKQTLAENKRLAKVK